MAESPRRIWLTGASTGLGAALADLLLQGGAHLAVSARAEAPLKRLAERFPGQVLLAPGDLTDHSQVKAIGQLIQRNWGALDSVILNAGTCEYMDAQAFDALMFERVLRTNLLATSYCIETALPLLRKGARPHLVGVASSVTYLPLPRSEAYGASKAGLRYLLESLRLDLAQESIAVTVVSPGFVDTPLTQQNDFPMPMMISAEKAAAYIARHLDKRPLEIAFPPVFIAALWCLSRLPARLKLIIGKRLVRQQSKEGDA